MAHCDQFANYFADITNGIRVDLDSRLVLQSLDVQGLSSSPVL